MNTLLGGLSPRDFLHSHWQKRPLLVRGAIPGFSGLLDPAALLDLATRDDIQARLVRFSRGHWQVAQGPFRRPGLARLPKRNWTMLLQELNHVLPAADAMLRRFDFLPHARLDDLMVSYAADGGGVGPHFDSYDVFLIQGQGRRRWRISAQADHELIPDAPLRILRAFRAEEEHVLEAGDMLYLPPRYAHDGVALGPCMTYSVGFRAPSFQEIATQFLVWLQDRVAVEGMLSDPDLAVRKHPAQLPATLLRDFTEAIGGVRWSKRDIARFAGMYLSEPKPHVFFDPPTPPAGLARFFSAAARRGVRLDRRTQLLFHGGEFFINGEFFVPQPGDRAALVELADRRTLPGPSVGADLAGRLHDWYCHGFLHVGQAEKK